MSYNGLTLQGEVILTERPAVERLDLSQRPGGLGDCPNQSVEAELVKPCRNVQVGNVLTDVGELLVSLESGRSVPALLRRDALVVPDDNLAILGQTAWNESSPSIRSTQVQPLTVHLERGHAVNKTPRKGGKGAVGQSRARH